MWQSGADSHGVGQPQSQKEVARGDHATDGKPGPFTPASLAPLLLAVCLASVLLEVRWGQHPLCC